MKALSRDLDDSDRNSAHRQLLYTFKSLVDPNEQLFSVFLPLPNECHALMFFKFNPRLDLDVSGVEDLRKQIRDNRFVVPGWIVSGGTLNPDPPTESAFPDHIKTMTFLTEAISERSGWTGAPLLILPLILSGEVLAFVVDRLSHRSRNPEELGRGFISFKRGVKPDFLNPQDAEAIKEGQKLSLRLKELHKKIGRPPLPVKTHPSNRNVKRKG